MVGDPLVGGQADSAVRVERSDDCKRHPYAECSDVHDVRVGPANYEMTNPGVRQQLKPLIVLNSLAAG